jgi:hypothetical protein
VGLGLTVAYIHTRLRGLRVCAAAPLPVCTACEPARLLRSTAAPLRSRTACAPARLIRCAAASAADLHGLRARAADPLRRCFRCRSARLARPRGWSAARLLVQRQAHLHMLIAPQAREGAIQVAGARRRLDAW